MLSATKLVAAGIAVFAAGAVLFVSVPLGTSPDTVPGAATTDAAGPAAYVHGAFIRGGCCGDEVETFDEDGNRLTLRGMVSSGTVQMDDPRLSGTFTIRINIDEYPQLDTTERVEIHWGELTITNDDGSWSGTWSSTYDSSTYDSFPPVETELALFELTGEGAYEGLSALLARTGPWPRMPVAGAIFPGPLPPR